MSGKKTKIKKTQCWEEAGGEFYQENYSEWDGLPKDKDTLTITTLLPSKQNRIGTYKRAPVRTNEHKNTKGWTSYSTTTRLGCQQNDAQFSLLPDLSQVLTDEERIWEEMLQIKLMPVSMQHKKELKASLQSATKLRLQGFNQLKWKHRKLWQKVCLKWSEITGKLALWQSSFRQVEGHFGTGVVAYFRFLRWLFFLNCFTFALIFIVIVLPNLLSDNTKLNRCITHNDNRNSSSCVYETETQTQFPFNIIQYLKGADIGYSYIFYGTYSNKLSEHSKNDTKVDSSFKYNLPLAYISIIIFCFALTLISIVRATAREFKDPLINGKWQFYQYCNIVFSGWDYCIHNIKTSNIKNLALYNEIKYLLQSKRIEIERSNRSKNYMYKLILIRIVVNIVIIAILLVSAYFLYILLNLSLKQQNAFYSMNNIPAQFNESDVEQKFSILEGDQIFTAHYDLNHLKKIFIEYVPFIVIVCLNLFLPIIFNYLCKFEKYSPFFVMKVSLLRTVFLRLASLVILLSRFYYIVIPHAQMEYPDKSAFDCWETFVGQQFVKLIITDFISHLVVTFCINFPRAFFARKIKHNFIKFIGEQEFELPKHVLDIIYSQTICWLGCFYSPFLPIFVAVIIFCMFYIKKFQCLVNSKPSKLFYGVSRSNSLFMLILLLSFLTSVIPITYAIAEIKPSLNCGPFRGLDTVWDAPIAAFISMPISFQNFIFFFGSASFSIPCFLLLILLLYYFHAVSDANKNMVSVLKNQLALEGHDKQFLLNRLSVYLRQQNSQDKAN